MMEKEWLIKKGSAYSLGDDWIGSDIYVDVEGEMAEICSVHLVLTRREHLQLRELENKRDESLDSTINADKKHWWERKKSDGEDNWREAHTKYMQQREDIYKRPKMLHDKYLSIILSAQSAVNLLKDYKENKTIDEAKLERVLSIANGDIAPMFQYAGQVCTCEHNEINHDTEYSWDKNGGKCTVENCACRHFEHATDIMGEISTVNIRELRQKEKEADEVKE